VTRKSKEDLIIIHQGNFYQLLSKRFKQQKIYKQRKVNNNTDKRQFQKKQMSMVRIINEYLFENSNYREDLAEGTRTFCSDYRGFWIIEIRMIESKLYEFLKKIDSDVEFVRIIERFE